MRLLARIICGVFCVLTTACCRPHFDPTRIVPLQDQWFNTSNPTARAVVVVIHGLNQDPRSLDQMAHELQGRGYHVYRPVLSGHLEKTVAPFSADVWISDVRRSIVEAQNRYSELPLFVIGYSLGGALATIVTSESDDNSTPRAMILIAPAISLRWPLDVLEATNIIPRSTFGFPSLAPVDYQRFSTTPLFWYSNTLDIYSRIDSLPGVKKLKHTPTLVLLNPEDELVSSQGVRDWIGARDLAGTWSVQEILPQPKRRGLPAHLFIDTQSAGDMEWRSMVELLDSFLRKNQ